jgi:hypothetical protein
VLTNAVILQSGSTLVSVPGTMDGLQLGGRIGPSAHSYLQGREHFTLSSSVILSFKDAEP